MHIVSALLCADDMVLMSCDRCELERMLQIMDTICNKMGMCINAGKTELMAYDPTNLGALPHGVELSGGMAKYVDVFKYLGGMITTACDCESEIRARMSKAQGRFWQMHTLWGMKRMQVTTKMRCYNAYVLPILLFGCETWVLTQQQMESLERVHSSCLRRILDVSVSDRHRLVDIRKQCNTVSLAEHITAARLRWFGHIMRMEHGRLPHIALFSTLWGKSRPRGRPPMRWTTLVSRDLQQQQLPTNMHELSAGPDRAYICDASQPQRRPDQALLGPGDIASAYILRVAHPVPRSPAVAAAICHA